MGSESGTGSIPGTVKGAGSGAGGRGIVVGLSGIVSGSTVGAVAERNCIVWQFGRVTDSISALMFVFPKVAINWDPLILFPNKGRR